MQGPEYLFSTQTKMKAFWQPDSAGMVTVNNSPYFLKYNPSGWEEISVKNVRNKDYFGVDRSISIPLNYVNDGAQILKHIFYNYGAEESVYLNICQQQLIYDVAPSGLIITLTGGNPFTSGNNTGTITGTPGSTVYVQLRGNGSIYTTGYIGTTLVSGISSTVYPIQIPGIGSINYNIFSAGSGNQLTLVNSNGCTTACYGYWYKQIFWGEIDFTSFIHVGSKVTCSTMEDGLAKYLKANAATVYDLTLPTDTIVKMDGINLHEKANYAITDGLNYHNTGGYSYALDAPFLNLEGDHSNATLISALKELIGFGPAAIITYANTSGNFIFKNDSPVSLIHLFLTGNIIIKFNLDGLGYGTNGIDIIFMGSTGSTHAIFTLNNPQIGFTYTIVTNADFFIQPNEKLFVIIQFHETGAIYDIDILQNSLFNFQFITRYQPTYIFTARPQWLFEELIKKVTDGNYTADKSAYLETLKDFVWTSGNAIRGLLKPNILISLTQFYHEYFRRGAGISEKNGSIVVIDKKENLIDKTTSVQLSEPLVLKIANDPNLRYNQVNYGYPAISTDVGTLNGNEEFNCGYITSLGTTKKPHTLDLVSKAIASCYEIEKVRTTYLGKTTTNYTNDNKLFLLVIESNLQTNLTPNYYNLDRSLNGTATGLLESASVFNLQLSPMRMFLDCGAWLRSCMSPHGTNLIFKFASAEKNTKLICNGIIEKQNVPMVSLAAPYFYSIIIDIDVPAPRDLITTMDINPLETFRFIFRGNEIRGILNTVSSGESIKNTQSYQLLMDSNTDLTQLIDYYG